MQEEFARAIAALAEMRRRAAEFAVPARPTTTAPPILTGIPACHGSGHVGASR